MLLSEKLSRGIPSVLAVDDDQDNLHLISYISEALNIQVLWGQ